MTIATAPYRMDEARALPPVGPSELAGDWIVCQVLTRHEKKVAEALDLCDIGRYMPLARHVRWDRNGVKRVTRIPLFAGYVFACVNRDADHYTIRQHDSIYGIIRISDQARFVKEISDIYRATEAGDVSAYNLPLVGQKCRVTSGKFESTEGFVEIAGDRRVFVLRVTILGQAGVALEIDPSLLEAID